VVKLFIDRVREVVKPLANYRGKAARIGELPHVAFWS